MRHQSLPRWVAACAVLALTACEWPAAPSTVPSLEGDWAGTIRHGVAGEGALTLSVSQRGPGIFGQWTSAYAEAASNQSGTFSGTITAVPFVLFLRPSVPIACGPDQTLSGTLTVNTTLTDDRISGPFTILNCTGVISGSVDVTRQ